MCRTKPCEHIYCLLWCGITPVHLCCIPDNSHNASAKSMVWGIIGCVLWLKYDKWEVTNSCQQIIKSTGESELEG
jgi:hypothetical protein